MRFSIPITALMFMRIFEPSSAVLAEEKPQIDSGFNLLYELKFGEARGQFRDWQQANPRDPLGHEAMAASYLFEEFYKQHILTSEFFLDDKRLLGGIPGKPDSGRKADFEAENRKGRALALRRLREDPRDVNALFALSIAAGMQADFAAVLDKRQMESLSLFKEAEEYAKQLLMLQPEEADAWFSLGAANYIIGSLPAYKRFFLWFRSVHGDKSLGMEQLRITAERGRYLKPFAEIFLALAATREGQENVARTRWLDLATRYPENPLFQTELARLGAHSSNSNQGGP